MQLEIEQKFPLADVDRLTASLSAIGAAPGERVEQCDTYFRHPARDFATTDEALRIRQDGDRTYLTYKGPKWETASKTRQELELPLVDAERWPEMLGLLGFEPLLQVRKTRQRFSLEQPPFQVEICWDQVDQLGDFVELEIVAAESQLEPAQQVLASLAAQLGLALPERRSYLELLVTG